MAKICDRIQSPNEDFTVLVKRKTDRDFKRLDSQELEPTQSDFQDTRYLDGVDYDTGPLDGVDSNTRSLNGIDIYNRHFDNENLEDFKDKGNGRLKD